jgi:hypothetical protein
MGRNLAFKDPDHRPQAGILIDADRRDTSDAHSTTRSRGPARFE